MTWLWLLIIGGLLGLAWGIPPAQDKPTTSWDKRYIGLIGDLSQTQEFQLHGVATEFDVGQFRSILFYSDDWKDAVLNPDGTVSETNTANLLVVSGRTATRPASASARWAWGC